MFTATNNKGFEITFANDWTVSVQWGTANYCAAQNTKAQYGQKINTQLWSSETAEVAAWDADHSLYLFGTNDVKGWMTADEVLALMVEIAAMPIKAEAAK